MGDPARKLESTEFSQEIGTILRADQRRFGVRTDSGTREAKRAVSCLVEPRAGDVVLVTAVQGGGWYVLAVLEREEGAAVSITLEGDLEIKLPAGRLGVAAQEGVAVASAKEVSVVSGRFDLNAIEGNVVFQRLTALGTTLRADIEKVKVFAGCFDAVMERLSQKVKRSYRTVEELDQVRAARIDIAAKECLSLRGGNTLITADELVKVNGEQIHLG